MQMNMRDDLRRPRNTVWKTHNPDRVSEWLLSNANLLAVSLRELIIFNEMMMMMSALY